MMNLMTELNLSGSWEIQDSALNETFRGAQGVSLDEKKWIPQPVPGDIHQGLVAAGRIPEPLLGMNSFKCAWTEQRAWWWRKIVDLPEDFLLAERVELEMNGLDSNAEIFINDAPVGSHRNAFRPFVMEVKSHLKPGQNVLLVRLTAGVETFSEADTYSCDGVRQDDGDRPERDDARRMLVRKPQYSFGWDWSPRLATTAIGGDVILRALNSAAIRDVTLEPVQLQNGVELNLEVKLEAFHYYHTGVGKLRVSLCDPLGRNFLAEKEVLLRSGLNFIPLRIHLDDPCLWWPNGMGDQALYRVEATLETPAGKMEYPGFDYGLRFLELETLNTFQFKVNGKPVFCKGANWIPADAIYARVPAERYRRLVAEAKAANFSMLRVWGGGLYEPEAFYQACDQAGILIWHDFMFACSPYPDHLDWFRQEVEKEADYQTKRLRHHACLAVWCGNNENHWGFHEWWKDKTHGGAWIYNTLLPETVRRNCPGVPYWNSSPYGGENPNAEIPGDQHHWMECMMNPEMEKRITPEEYDKTTAWFVSEYGYIGSCGRETVEEYLDGATLERTSPAWRHHTNTFEKDTVLAGIRKHYIDTQDLTWDDYFLYSGLTQGLMYSYSLESMRFRETCHGALFWMFEDCWGEVGWTIIDYALRRKPSWYFVRRALAPVRLIIRADGAGCLRVVLANDTLQAVKSRLEYGYASLDGADSDSAMLDIEAGPCQRTCLLDFPHKGRPSEKGVWFARLLDSPETTPAIYRARPFRELEVSDPALRWEWQPASLTEGVLTVHARAYAHAVCLNLPAGCTPADNYFDLLPGETRQIQVTATGEIDLKSIDVSCVH